MNTRIPLIVAVVGALLVGGATTGTTRASWVDSSTQASSKVTSGRMAMSASVSAASVTVPRGESRSVSLTLKDDSTTSAKNLKQKLDATTSSSSPSNVSASISASGGSCSGVALPQTVTPGQQRTSCVTVTAPAGATPGQYTVTVVPTGAQSPSGGWRSVVSSVPITVTVTAPGPSAPSGLSCDGGTTGSNGGTGVRLKWTLNGSSSYKIYQALSSAPTTFTAVGTPGSTTSTFTTTGFGQNEVRYYRITGLQGTSESSPSATLKVDRNGNSSNFTCVVQ